LPDAFVARNIDAVAGKLPAMACWALHANLPGRLIGMVGRDDDVLAGD
jgi:hypothetical protein